MIKMNEDMLKQIIIDTIKEEEHLGDNLKKQCVDYINELESQQANNCFFQGGRGSGKTYITKLEQQLSLYKEVIEEVREITTDLYNIIYNSEYEKFGLSREQYRDRFKKLLQILDKEKDSDV